MKKIYKEWEITIWIVIWGILLIILVNTETIVRMIID